MSDIIEIMMRAFVAFLSLMLLAHVIGKQMIAQMTYHQFVAAITLGSIAGNTVFNIKIKFLYFVISLLIFSGIALALTFLALRSRKARKWIVGEPTVVIQNGKILEQNMRKLKYTFDSLNQGLREKDIFNVEEVDYAILETNGTLSVLKKPAFRHVTIQDLALNPPSTVRFPVELIIEGEIMEKNLHQQQLTTDWIVREVSKRGLILSDVCYAVMGTNGHLYFDRYEDHISSPIDKE
ncbi:DUF421 domain-containing protein [Aneurinibacillus uraniidurans]|uniref:DUF421 domain-containing protein n=1 Tax=Aneurinibacillus uraniidurans TaxID=2966586 RepID=UPI00234BB873|nr:DUF421 domain-containing protein [Aneurinibacillus sp. B1]WCN39179.1 DUF421 domain-containing protein [Aneurinibacillus sp. B1]